MKTFSGRCTTQKPDWTQTRLFFLLVGWLIVLFTWWLWLDRTLIKLTHSHMDKENPATKPIRGQILMLVRIPSIDRKAICYAVDKRNSCFELFNKVYEWIQGKNKRNKNYMMKQTMVCMEENYSSKPSSQFHVEFDDQMWSNKMKWNQGIKFTLILK